MRHSGQVHPLPKNTPAKVVSERGQEGEPLLGPHRVGWGGQRRPHGSLAGWALPSAIAHSQVGDRPYWGPSPLGADMKTVSVAADDLHTVGVQKCVRSSLRRTGVRQESLRAPLPPTPAAGQAAVFSEVEMPLPEFGQSL